MPKKVRRKNNTEIASDINSVASIIRSNLRNSAVPFWTKLAVKSSKVLKGAILSNDENLANRAWFINTVIDVYRFYCECFDLMRAGKFFDAWCLLERVELSVADLVKNPILSISDFGVDFIKDRVEAFQALFPYKIFFSPEMIVKRYECSICGNAITPWSDCQHEIGKVYMGKCCFRIAKDCKLVSISMVTTPVQKYSVATTVSDGKGNTYDPHDYSTVTFVVKRIESPFDDWSARWTKAYHPHSLFSHIGENDFCPCGSGAAYSDCCRKRPGVLRPHLHIEFEKHPPKELPHFELSGYDKRPQNDQGQS